MHALNSKINSKTRKEVCAYEKVCVYKKGTLNNPSLRYVHVCTYLSQVGGVEWGGGGGGGRVSIPGKSLKRGRVAQRHS